MSATGTWKGKVNEDSSYSVLARVCALGGTGTQVKDKEGPSLKKADVSAIVCKVFALGTNENNVAGTPVTPDPTVTPAANLYDTLQTLGWDTNEDPAGYNFRHDLTPAYCPNPREWYLLEYKFTLSGTGQIAFMRVKVKTVAVQSS